MTPLTSNPHPAHQERRVAVVGAGPAGLMAAEVLASQGCSVDVYDAMPSAGRKFLLAGKGGLNLTHSEAMEAFRARYGQRAARVAPLLAAFGPAALRAWAQGLGVSTFVGSSGRVFPAEMKAAPLLRAWLHRLRAAGARFHMRHRWAGWGDGGDGVAGGAEQGGAEEGTAAPAGAPHALRFTTPTGEITVCADVVALALGGASWPRLGSDAAWVPWLAARGVDIAPLKPSNCGFDVLRTPSEGHEPGGWTEHFRSRFAGQPLKTVALAFNGDDGVHFQAPGEFIVTDTGIEGSLVYAASAALRDHLDAHGRATLHVDLLPGRSAAFVRDEVARPRGSRSLSTHLKSRLGLTGVKAALLHELLPREVLADAPRLADAIKALPLTVGATRPIEEAISTAGGVRFEAMDAGLMLRAVPGVFCAGEMLDWESPTGGYLLTACFASGAVAGGAASSYLQSLGRPAPAAWVAASVPM